MSFVPASRPAPQSTDDAWHFAFVGRDLLIPEADSIALQPLASRLILPLATDKHYLGTLAAVDCWALRLHEAPSGWRPTPLRAAMMALPPEVSAVAGRAAQIVEWDRSHRFCGVCGSPTELHPGERSRVCPSCGQTAYPRVSPAMMALVWRPGELLLARSPHYAKGMYSALAGFVEPGESLEQCLAREVAEEVGVRIGAARYFASQSWPFPHSLMVAFTAEHAGGELAPDGDEIAEARWFGPGDALPELAAAQSIARALIDAHLPAGAAAATP